MKQLIDGVENEGWRFVAFTRLVPLFPLNLLNYALGLGNLTTRRAWRCPACNLAASYHFV